MAKSTPLVLQRLTNGQRIADQNGIADPLHIQNLNNAFQTIATFSSDLQTQESELAAQQATQATLTQNVSDALATLEEVQGQVSAVTGASSRFALADSFTAPAVVISAATVNGASTITVAAHTRRYADGSSVAVNGGSISVTAKGQTLYVIYADAGRTGGNVAYQLTSDPATAAQIGNVHNCGSVYVSSGDATNAGTANYGPGVSAPAPAGGVA